MVVDALQRAGHEVADLAVRRADDLTSLARNHPEAIVFNLCYGLRATKRSPGLDQPGIAAALVEAGVGVVGSGAEAQRRCQDKAQAAELVAEIGVASPRAFTVEEAVAHGGPFVVKPRAGAAHRDVRLVAGPDQWPNWPRSRRAMGC